MPMSRRLCYDICSTDAILTKKHDENPRHERKRLLSQPILVITWHSSQHNISETISAVPNRGVTLFNQILIMFQLFDQIHAFSALTLLAGWQEGHLACKKLRWGSGMVICLERGADLHIVSWCHCHSLSLASVKSRLVFTFLVPAHLGSPGQRAVK